MRTAFVKRHQKLSQHKLLSCSNSECTKNVRKRHVGIEWGQERGFYPSTIVSVFVDLVKMIIKHSLAMRLFCVAQQMPLYDYSTVRLEDSDLSHSQRLLL